MTEEDKNQEEPKAEETPAEEPKAEETPAEEPKAEEKLDFLGKVPSNNSIDTFSSGDTVILNLLIKEGDRERVQSFQGNVIRGSHINGNKVLPGKTFTVRRISSGVGVERTVPISSPSIESVKVTVPPSLVMVKLPRLDILEYLISRASVPAPPLTVSA